MSALSLFPISVVFPFTKGIEDQGGEYGVEAMTGLYDVLVEVHGEIIREGVE